MPVCQPMGMSLTFPGAPLASEPPITTNYAIDGPRHRLLLHPFPRRVRARFAGEVVLDSTRGALLHESNILPRLYVPLEDVRADLLERTDHTTHCPFKGDASYWSVRVGDRVAENAVWTYEEPDRRGVVAARPGQRLPRAHGRLARRGRGGHRPARPLPPRRRAAQLAAHRGPRRRRGPRAQRAPGRRGRDRRCPLRFYLPREDVSAELRPSDTTATCPYKGRASYWSLDGIEDVAWSYEEPLESMLAARDHVCFDASKVEVSELTA